jgi:hypothetical protein
MDVRGRCQDNILIERLWWTLKRQYIYLYSFDTVRACDEIWPDRFSITFVKGAIRFPTTVPRIRFISVCLILLPRLLDTISFINFFCDLLPNNWTNDSFKCYF